MQEASAPSQVILYHRREGEAYTGWVAAGEEVYERFDKVPFRSALTLFAQAANDFPHAALVFFRNDRPGLAPFALDEKTQALLRTDPEKVIASMHIESPSRPAPVTMPLVPPLRAGYDSLARSFGDRIYIPLQLSPRRGQINCPVCSFWGVVRKVDDLSDATFFCRKCPRHVMSPPLELEASEYWVSVATEDLLRLPVTELYLLCAWSTSPWILRDDLERMYRSYLTEKEQACSLL